MPFDLASVERGYGEVPVAYNGHTIVVQYRADLDSRAILAMQRMLVGVPVVGGGGQRFPDIDGILIELERLLVGWDITRSGQAVPVARDELLQLPPTLPMLMLQAIVGDINDPNRRRPSLNGSSARAGSPPIASPITTGSSQTHAGPGSPPGLSLVSTTTPGDGRVGIAG